jgi:hypothetical protein
VVAASNSPGGSESPFPSVLKNYLRAALAFIAQNYADILTLQTSLTTVIPAGVIVMWSGSASAIPTGYTLCDGSNGTPDLRNRFVIGAGSTYAVGATGGATSSTTDLQGSHSHTITGNVGTTVLDITQIPAHTHTIGKDDGGFNDNPSNVVSGTDRAQVRTATTSSAGGGGGHLHSVGSLANDTYSGHQHSVSTVPPYYALCFIKKT